MATIRLGDRKFTVTDFEHRNVLQDQFLMATLIRSGVDKLLPQDDESDAGFIARCDGALLASGKAHELAAGLLVPEGVEFDTAIAKTTAAHVATLTDPDDRERVQDLALTVLFGFHVESLRRLNKLGAVAWSQPRRGRVRRFVSALLPNWVRG